MYVCICIKYFVHRSNFKHILHYTIRYREYRIQARTTFANFLRSQIFTTELSQLYGQPSTTFLYCNYAGLFDEILK